MNRSLRTRVQKSGVNKMPAMGSPAQPFRMGAPAL